MTLTSAESLSRLRDAALDRKPVSLGQRRTGSPHEYYRYPARFSPGLVSAAIEAFTRPGALITDPFVGGGTSAVEAQRLGRRSIVSDLNPLATFVTRVKTRLLSDSDRIAVQDWLDRAPLTLRLNQSEPDSSRWEAGGYFKGLTDPETWRLRKFLALALDSLPEAEGAEEFCRCIVLRAAQWALDMRGSLPGVDELRRVLIEVGTSMLGVAADCAVHLAGRPCPRIVTQGLPGLAALWTANGWDTPALIVTSPPYPGVYVNYHRWKMLGRKEIKAPYWISNQLDGHGLAHYTMSARAEPTLAAYFGQLEAAYTDLSRVMGPDTTLVQVVGFNDLDSQLDRYLRTMSASGLVEVRSDDLATDADGRLWREVPGRRWWTEARSRKGIAEHTAREVVLVHRRAD